MNAIELKRQIDKKIDNVARTIAFSYSEKYFDTIINRIKNVPYYVYDNESYQVDRLENIELVDIAKEFAKDLTWDLSITDIEKNDLEEKLAKVICMGKDFGVSDGVIKKVVYDNPLLRVNYEDNVEQLQKVINYFKNDYKVKEIVARINESVYKQKAFQYKVIEQKGKILKEELHIDNLDEENIDYVWDLLSAFSPSVDMMLDKEEYIAKQEEFYEIIGCVGDSIEALKKDAKIKKKYIDESKYRYIKEKYSDMLNDLIRDYYKDTSNITEIFDDLKEKGYRLNEGLVSAFLIESRHISGVNFACFDSEDNESNFIVYCNNYLLYSREFIETCIHEFIHSIGGANITYEKRGLHYKEYQEFIHLEEAYANFISKKIANEYFEQYGNIISIRCKESSICKYDSTLEYFSVVWDLYKAQIQDIHINKDISYNEAKKIFPQLENIVKSLSKIMNARHMDVDRISKEEIEKLIRRNSR